MLDPFWTNKGYAWPWFLLLTLADQVIFTEQYSLQNSFSTCSDSMALHDHKNIWNWSTKNISKWITLVVQLSSYIIPLPSTWIMSAVQLITPSWLNLQICWFIHFHTFINYPFSLWIHWGPAGWFCRRDSTDWRDQIWVLWRQQECDLRLKYYTSYSTFLLYITVSCEWICKSLKRKKLILKNNFFLWEEH